MSISKIKEINKAFDEKFPNWPEPNKGAGEGLGPLAGVGMYMQYDEDRKLWVKNKQEIKDFYTQQILSLIEELEGKLPRKKDNDDIETIKTFDGVSRKHVTLVIRRWGKWNEAVDQMRASIKEFKEKL